MEAAASRPVRIAFLGTDDSTAELARAVFESPDCELVGICEFEAARDPAAAELRPLAGRLRPIADWEDLLDDRRIDAVVVARGADEDLRAEQMRKFIQTEMPVLVSHPVVGSMLLYYELDMIRRETNSAVVPELPRRAHPAVQALVRIVGEGEDSPIGKVEHLNVERCIADPTREHVERHFARDVDLVRAIAGDMTRLGAMAGGGASSFASLGVQMSGPAEIAARWSVVPIQGAEGAQVTLTGPRGRAELHLAADDAPWSLQVTADGETRQQEFDAFDAPRASLEQLIAAIRGRRPAPDWVDAARSVELTETIDRSLEKARTIELYYEDYTEEATFKGTMTSVGCGLLLLAVFALALVGIAEQMNIPYVRYWPYVLAGLLGVFLAAQLALFVRGKGAASDEHPSEQPSADAAEPRA